MTLIYTQIETVKVILSDFVIPSKIEYTPYKNIDYFTYDFV